VRASRARWLSRVLLVLGVLALAEAGVTVLWQEPVTSLIAHFNQRELTRAYAQAERRFGAPRVTDRAELRRLAASYRRGLGTGGPIGVLSMPTLGRHYTIVQGTEAPQLAKGPGHLTDTRLPGEGGTFAVAGHRTTYLAPFRHVDDLHAGDTITVRLPYATFSYRVTRSRIVVPTDVAVTRSVGFEQLVLSACHPVYSASHRIIVFARLRSVTSARRGTP
jgi:sortase A